MKRKKLPESDLVQVNFKADARTIAAMDNISAHTLASLPSGSLASGIKGLVIRSAIIEKSERLGPFVGKK